MKTDLRLSGCYHSVACRRETRPVRVVAAVLLFAYSVPYADPSPGYELASERAGRIVDVRVHHELIDVDARGVTLGEVFGEIEGQSAIRFEAAQSIADRVVSARFADLPIVEGIQRLLAEQDYMIDHAPPPSAQESASLIVRVLGESSHAVRAAPRGPTATEDADEAAWQRAQRLNDLAADADSATITAAVEQAIQDPHQAVREAALEVVEMMEEDDAPVLLVAEVALRDGNPDLRIAALDLLDALSDAHREVVLQTFRQAANDRHEEVKELARDLGDALETDN